MDSIQPIKREIVPAEPSVSDTPETRVEYDRRITNDTQLAEQYRHYPLMDFFGLELSEREDESNNSKVKDVNTWLFNRFPDVDLLEKIKALRLLEREIGLPQMGDTRLNNLWSFIQIDNQIDRLKDEKRARYGQ